MSGQFHARYMLLKHTFKLRKKNFIYSLLKLVRNLFLKIFGIAEKLINYGFRKFFIVVRKTNNLQLTSFNLVTLTFLLSC